MTNLQEPVRVYVHRAMKWIAAFGIVIFSLGAYNVWQRGLPIMIIALVPQALLSIWVFFLADTEIDVDQNEIRILAPHGTYVMSWAEVKSVQPMGLSAYFFGDNKVIAYNLLLAGKGKREFQSYVADLIHQQQIPMGRPDGITNSQMRRLIRNTRVRGWKLF